MTEKLVLIGAGSAMFTRGVVADLLRSKVAADLALVDIDPAALEAAYRLAEKMVQASQAPIRLTAALDRRAVLPGATAVITTIGVGGRRAWEQDVYIPRKYGIYMPVGDTVGPGGSSRALRMIPPMVAIAQDVLDLAPEALFFNYANPMAPICRAVRKATGADMVGLCIGTYETAHYLARALGVPFEELSFSAGGINHLTWFHEVTLHGQSAMPALKAHAARQLENVAEILARAKAKAGGLPHSDSPFDPSLDFPFSWQCLLWFGAYPAPQDRHVTEFFPQLFRTGAYFGKTLGVDEFSFEGTIASGDQIYAEMKAIALSPQPLTAEYFEKLSGEHEQAIDILQSIRANRTARFYANLPNRGQVPNLPLEAIVETPAISDGRGVHALVQPPLPAAAAGALATRYGWVDTIVEAALEGSRDKFIAALILDGGAGSPDQAVQLADELLAAQGAYLPGFNG